MRELLAVIAILGIIAFWFFIIMMNEVTKDEDILNPLKQKE
jgi:hypothetical protein